MGSPDLLFQGALPLRSTFKSNELAAQLSLYGALLEDTDGGA